MLASPSALVRLAVMRDEREQQERDALITLPEASRRVGLSMRQLRRARERGELAIYLIGGWPRVRWVDVVAWIESRRQTVRATARRSRCKS